VAVVGRDVGALAVESAPDQLLEPGAWPLPLTPQDDAQLPTQPLAPLCASCSSGRGFASSFLQILPRGEHPCCSASGSCHRGPQGTCIPKSLPDSVSLLGCQRQAPGLALRAMPGAQKETARGMNRGPSGNLIPRQRPTLPRTCARSTIGAEGLNCRVRNGNGCFPLATATGKLGTGKNRGILGSLGSWSTGSGQSDRIRRLGRILVKPNDRLVQVSSTPRSAYTSCLSTWSSTRGLQGYLILGGASRLDAFSGYPFRT
jgi:hypothetical protein